MQDRAVYLPLLAWKALLYPQMTTRLQCLFLGFCSHMQHEYLWLLITSWTTPKHPDFHHTSLLHANKLERRRKKGLFPNMPWVYKLWVVSSKILEFPASHCSCDISYDLLDGGGGVTVYLGTVQQPALYNQLIWTILSHLLYSIMKTLEKWVCALKGRVLWVPLYWRGGLPKFG